MNTPAVKEPRSRAAGPSITGYAYQFDLTTLAILGSDSGAVITVEGCEDVDIDSASGLESVQCKYYASAAYSLANIRDAILPMLRAFTDGNRRHYRLYVHFGDGSAAPDRLTVGELKEALTERKRKPPGTVFHYDGIDDSTLQGFVDSFNITSGSEFGAQHSAVLAALYANFGGSLEDAEQLHYGNSLALVMELAMRSDEADRRITKLAFVDQVNKRPKLYTRWHKEHVGREKYLRVLQRSLKTVGAVADRRRRAIIIDVDKSGNGGLIKKIVNLIEFLSTNMYGPGRLKSARPWTVILIGDQESVLGVKVCLATRGAAFNDGYEHLAFNSTVFEADPLINTKFGGDKIFASSYLVRIVGGSTYEAHRGQLSIPDLVIDVGEHSLQQYLAEDPKFVCQVPAVDPETIISFLEGAAG